MNPAVGSHQLQDPGVVFSLPVPLLPQYLKWGDADLYLCHRIVVGPSESVAEAHLEGAQCVAVTLVTMAHGVSEHGSEGSEPSEFLGELRDHSVEGSALDRPNL